ncbi:HNH endonuclease [Methylicorpusculum oleiharenae]|uniref:HNH endonuclease n=1 Tax=Methylicorpusculum oleiharenae TaxID=1338687 RepID=UPI00135AD3C4|nr:HNH endonuclease [Methylicorpusculum oleiharenae]MCD2451655.1 HNH endonuclease [Methylicorpusculum oleiharenae]
MKNLLTQERLKELLRYDPETGMFTWLASPANSVKVGAIAGSVNGKGYIHIKINSKTYRAHRLAFFYHFGRWPKNDVDHMNGVKTDNRIENLRDANKSENQQNRGVQSNNTSGYMGVSYDKRKKKWKAEIMINRKTNRLGRFSTPEEAHAAYLSAKKELHTFQPTPRAAHQEGGEVQS